MESIAKIKELIKEKFETIIEPERNDIVICIREELVDMETSKKNYELSVGKVMKFTNKISINGKVYRSDEFLEIKEGGVNLSLPDLRKPDDRTTITLVKVPKTFYRAIDEATWAGNLKKISDLVKVIEDFN
ncbi:MAG: hypothetical protein ACFFCS_10845 [Candidatus Hodarchaeota archaeon]